jgi:predicted nucleotidyltransferase
VLRWPDRETVDRAVRDWARDAAASHQEVTRIGYFGSYARGDAGVGSDLDILVIVTHAADRAEHRRIGFDTSSVPVPVDLLVYTERELEALRLSRFARMLEQEAVWVWPR